MTLDEAIKHCYEKVKKCELRGEYGCADDHLQLGKWLEELQDYRNKDEQDTHKPLTELFNLIGITAMLVTFGFLFAFVFAIIYKGGLKCLELFF